MAYELSEFVRQRARVIPVAIDDEGARHLPLPLHLDFRNERQFQQSLHPLIQAFGHPSSLSVEAPRIRPTGYVFISYADEDFEFVEELKLFFRKKGYAYWDYRTTGTALLQRNWQAHLPH
jgi:hypothetical protein